jgi:transcriptional regulator with XRE-family HTH domain
MMLSRASLSYPLEYSSRGHVTVTLAGMSLGSEIRRRRLALGLTLDDLSERSGLSPHYLSTLENDRRDPHVSTLYAVAKGLRVAPAELLGPQPADARPTVGALYELAPAEARAAVTTLLRLVVAPSRRPVRRPKARG